MQKFSRKISSLWKSTSRRNLSIFAVLLCKLHNYI